jgi:hypothetical protein
MELARRQMSEVVASRFALLRSPTWCGDGRSRSAITVSSARRRFDWQLEDICGTSTFDEAARSRKLRCARLDLGGRSRFWRALEAVMACSGLRRLALLGSRLGVGQRRQ